MRRKENNKNILRPEEAWEVMSEDGKRLADILSSSDLSHNKEFLNIAARDEEYGFHLEDGLNELKEIGVVEEITLLEEKEEQLRQLLSNYEDDDFIFKTDSEISIERLDEYFIRMNNLTLDDVVVRRLKREIDEYFKYKGRYPERYNSWEEKRFKLTPDFQQFMEASLE